MPGIRALRKIQLGREVTPGTAVVATAVWRGKGTFEDLLELVHPAEDVGVISGEDRTHIRRVLGRLKMEPVEATFEQLPYLLAGGIKNVVTGAADGAGSGKIYAYPMHTTALNTLQPHTLEGGDDQQEEEAAFGFVERISLTGRQGEAVMMSADWLCRQIAPSTFTGSLSLPTVEDVIFLKGKVWIDAVAGAHGGTLKSKTLTGFELAIKTGAVPLWAADGELFFSDQKWVDPEVTLRMTFEHDGTAVAEKANWRAQTPRLVRVQFEGATLGTAGTSYSKKTLRIDVAGKWEKFDALDEQDGNDIVNGTLRVRRDPTASKFCEITVVNEVASLP